ncbi:activating transcription factor 7-interacting protein 1 [Musca domestica]|uniref:Activating transcription factor 7-interacting protein 1 n=1 Tax=Musca domestica TaxID=7370 RepID=A0A1I8MVY4_MUSDO|nr:activating transcription factor 7-interacting protein 1 [Musca domestica]
MTEVKADETEVNADNAKAEKEMSKEDTAPPASNEKTTQEEEKEEELSQQAQQTSPPPPSSSSENDKEAKDDGLTLNPLNNDNEHQSETEIKGKNRRYWTPKEEDRFFLIWGRENWRLTKHGKNTIFFAQWAEEMKERFDIDVKPEEVQCKVNQTRAKYRQVKRLLETDRNAVKWKKYDLVEKILKNQYRSKDDEPVPQEALENNRDMSPTELLNSNSDTRPPSPNVSNISNSEQSINLNQTPGDNQQITEDVSLTEQNLSSNVFSNNSNTSFSTELFGLDQMEIKKEIEGDIKMEGFSEFLPIDPQETTNSSADGQKTSQSVTVVTPQAMPPELEAVINGNMGLAAVNNSRGALPNHTNLPLVSTNANSGVDGNVTNHTNSNHTTMEPPRRSSVSSTTTPRKRNRSASSSTAAATAGGATSTALTTAASAAAAMAQDSLEHLYLEEIKKKNIILVEQGEINRKRLRLEERKVKLMEDFFPKYLSLQQDILKKLDNLNNSTPESINIRIED